MASGSTSLYLISCTLCDEKVCSKCNCKSDPVRVSWVQMMCVKPPLPPTLWPGGRSLQHKIIYITTTSPLLNLHTCFSSRNQRKLVWTFHIPQPHLDQIGEHLSFYMENILLLVFMMQETFFSTLAGYPVSSSSSSSNCYLLFVIFTVSICIPPSPSP